MSVKFTRDHRGVAAYLRSAQLGAAVMRAANDVAARVAAAPSTPYDRMPTPVVQALPSAGARGDRVGAQVVVPAPPPSDVRWPDTKGRFKAVTGVVGQVSS